MAEHESGELIYERARDAPPPREVFPAEQVEQMNTILHQVTEAGTGRRARLEGIGAAGKTGTTQAYRDAWFLGYTGKYVTGVWYGNDDFTSTGRLTGGRLPAMTWQRYMAFAHSGVEVPDIPGVPGSGSGVTVIANNGEGDNAGDQRPRPLSFQTLQVLNGLSKAFDNAIVSATRDDGGTNVAAREAATPPATQAQ